MGEQQELAAKLTQPDKVSRRQVAELYSIYAGLPPAAAQQWLTERSVELQVGRRWLRDKLAGEEDRFLYEIRRASMTHAQRVAATLGATVTKAIRRLSKNLDAKTIRAVKVLGGKKGETVDVEQDDFAAQNAAARDVLRIWGAFAPEKIVFDRPPEGTFDNLTDEEVERELLTLKATVTEPIQPGLGLEKGALIRCEPAAARKKREVQAQDVS